MAQTFTWTITGFTSFLKSSFWFRSRSIHRAWLIWSRLSLNLWRRLRYSLRASIWRARSQWGSRMKRCFYRCLKLWRSRILRLTSMVYSDLEMSPVCIYVLTSSHQLQSTTSELNLLKRISRLLDKLTLLIITSFIMQLTWETLPCLKHSSLKLI